MQFFEGVVFLRRIWVAKKVRKKGSWQTKVLLLGSVLQNARGPGEDIGGG